MSKQRRIKKGIKQKLKLDVAAGTVVVGIEVVEFDIQLQVVDK